MSYLPGDIGFVMHKKNLLSRTIAWFMGSQWSHAFIVLEATPTRTYILETSDFEVMVSDLGVYLSDPDCHLVVYSPAGLSDLMRELVCQEAMKNLKSVYGYAQLISLGIRRLLMRVGIRINNFFRNGLVCCHVVTYGYRISRIPGLSGIDPESIDTEELFQIVDKSPRFTKVMESGG